MVLTVATVAASASGSESFSRELADAYGNLPKTWINEYPWTGIVVLSPLLFAKIAGIVGLFQLKPWGRTLSLYVTIVGPLIFLFSGPSLCTPLQNMLYEASTLLWAALLAVAYCAPLSAHFAASGSARKVPSGS